MSKPTCGVFYLEAFLKYTNGEPALARAFAAGFVNGQAEKVYLGACRACMFRPSEERRGMVVELATDAGARYGLHLYLSVDEVWLLRCDDDIPRLTEHARNSPGWHCTRGRLCGVPPPEFDERFHERAGYGEPCDVIERKEGECPS